MKYKTIKFIRSFTSKYGKRYTPAILPSAIKRGKPGDCFDHCMMQAIEHPEYKYVEGLALDPTNDKRWVYHAWLTDGTYAYDPTWKAENQSGKERPVPTIYMGIEFDIEDIARFVRATEYKAILANRWRNPELFQEILKGMGYGK